MAACECKQWECKECRMRTLGRQRPVKYALTPALEAGLREAYRAPNTTEMRAALRRLRASRPGWPVWAWTQAAARLRIASPCSRKPWTPAEDRKLMLHLGSMPLAAIARMLGRGTPSVRSRCAVLEWSWRLRDGFTAADLAECFGVDAHRAARWIRDGKFGRELIEVGTMVRVPECGVRLFIRRHTDQYDLRRVNPVWFKGFVFGGGAER